MAFDTHCQMPSKTDFCVRSLTQIAWKNGTRPFVPGAANDRKEPEAAIHADMIPPSGPSCFRA
jgi:hypothetical protein